MQALLGLFLGALAYAQGPARTAPGAMRIDNGVVANGKYSNDCLGFSLSIPSGWEVNSRTTGVLGRAAHMPSGDLLLLQLDHHGVRSTGHLGITAKAVEENLSVKDLVAGAVHSQADKDPQTRHILREVSPVEYGGQHFSRSDYTQSLPSGSLAYISYVYTSFRNYYIGENVSAGSSDELDEAVSVLDGISFQDDDMNPLCVVGDPEPQVLGGVISSQPVVPQGNARVRVSRKVCEALLAKKVDPVYPEDALKTKTEGPVMLRALIDRDGNVEQVSAISGDPYLVPAAVTAVQQWKYKPYLISGQPVKVETQIVIDFQLPKK